MSVLWAGAVLFICAGVSARVSLPVVPEIGKAEAFAGGCEIEITGSLTEPQPLLLVRGTDQFLVPDNAVGILRLNAGAQFEISCNTGRFNISNVGNIATCVEGTTFTLEGSTTKHDFSEFFCSGFPFHTARRTGKSCPSASDTHIEVGFSLPDGRFLWLMDICHNEPLASTSYTYFELTPANAGFQRSFPRPSFIQGDFFGFPVNTAYTRANQQTIITSILNSAELAGQIIHPTNDFFMARGHLAAKVDYIYGSQQRGTFYFLNTCPQWQVFNAGNWERVENGVRTFVANRGINAQIYTGSFGVVSFPDVSGIRREIYLHFDANNNPRLPVPKIYYKVVIDPATKSGVVLIGINNPYVTLSQIKEEYTFCTDVSDKLNWVGWDRENIHLGYSYACEVQEFAKAVGHLPPLDVQNLLY